MKTKQHHACTILRTFVRTSYKSLDDAQHERNGKSETVTEACNIPLFGNDARTSGVCSSCAEGWEVEENKFANDAERKRAKEAR